MNQPTTFSNYAVESVLASNNFSHRYTYKCRDLTGNPVVLKEFRFGENKSWEPYLLVEKEIDILKKLDHNRIPKYIDRFDTPTSVFFVQEYIEGKALSSGNWTETEVIEMLLSVLDTLIYLQENHIIHGDIKPDNILLQGDRYYLVDFGLTKVLKEEKSSTVIGGTTDYMPPEVMIGRGLNFTSDIYSLAKTALTLLSPSATVNFDFSVDLSGIEGLLRKWLKKALEANPNYRYPNAKLAREGLAKYLKLVEKSLAFEAIERRSVEMSSGMGLALITLGLVGSVGSTVGVETIQQTIATHSTHTFARQFKEVAPGLTSILIVVNAVFIITGVAIVQISLMRND